MGLVGLLYSIIIGAVVFAIIYMREKLNMKLTTALKFLGIVVGGFLLIGLLAMGVEEGSLGHILLLLLVGSPAAIVLFCGLFYDDGSNSNNNNSNPPGTPK